MQSKLMDPNKAFRDKSRLFRERPGMGDIPLAVPAGEGHDLAVNQVMNRLAFSNKYGMPIGVVTIEGITVEDIKGSTYTTGWFTVKDTDLPSGSFVNFVSGRCYRYNFVGYGMMFRHAPAYQNEGVT